MTIDLLPTLARLAGADLPKLPIDGKDIGPLLRGEAGATSPHEALYFYWGQALEAVRAGPWKLHFPHTYRSMTGKPGSGGQPGGYSLAKIGLSLFNLEKDVGETT